MHCGDLISRAVDIRVPHNGTKYLDNEILLICPVRYIFMRLRTYILVRKIQIILFTKIYEVTEPLTFTS